MYYVCLWPVHLTDILYCICIVVFSFESFSWKTTLNFVCPTALNVQIEDRPTSKWSFSVLDLEWLSYRENWWRFDTKRCIFNYKPKNKLTSPRIKLHTLHTTNLVFSLYLWNIILLLHFTWQSLIVMVQFFLVHVHSTGRILNDIFLSATIHI